VCEEPVSQRVIKKTFTVYGTLVFKNSVALRKPFSPYFKEKTNGTHETNKNDYEGA